MSARFVRVDDVLERKRKLREAYQNRRVSIARERNPADFSECVDRRGMFVCVTMLG